MNDASNHDSEGIMSEIELSLSGTERDCVIDVLESALKEMRVEEHRTRAPKYREHLLERENMIVEVLYKLKVAAPQGLNESLLASPS